MFFDLSIEKRAHQLLNDLGDCHLVADKLLSLWENSDTLTFREVQAIAQFCLQAGAYDQLLKTMIKKLRSRNYIPLYALGELFKISKGQLNKEQALSLLHASNYFKISQDIVQTNAFDSYLPEITKMRQKYQAQQKDQLKKKKQSLINKLELMKAQRLVLEEEHVLNELFLIFPRDTTVQKAQKEHKEKWAREVIGHHGQRRETKDFLQNLKQKLTPEQESARNDLFSQAISKAKSEPVQAYDLALMFSFMEFHEQAFELLQYAPDSKSKDWLQLEELVKARQFLSALEMAERLEIEYANQPETTFSIIYARARCLWNLGRKSTAIELMRSIVKLRPNYRSARALLSAWEDKEL